MNGMGDTGAFEAMRHQMVASQLRTNAVSDPRVVAAMARVPREKYLPDSAARLAYRDTAVPLAHGRKANLPIAIGKLLTEARVKPSDSVLLIGAAGGYTAAVLAELAGEVIAVESDPVLAADAHTALAGFTNVTVIEGSLEDGCPSRAPFDLLVIDGAIERLPEALIAQLKVGGRAVAGLNDRGVTRLASGRRSEGGFALADFADIDCVALPGFAPTQSFTF